MPRVLKDLLLVGMLFALPLAGNIGALVSWRAITAIVFIYLLQVTQPAVTTKDMVTRDPKDVASVRLLAVTWVFTLLASLLEYAYGKNTSVRTADTLAAIGFALAGSGLAFRIWSIRTLGRYFTAKVEILDGHRVVDVGPYRYLRHPSYSGAFALTLGITLILGSVWGIASLFLLFFPAYLFRIRVEEKALLDGLGESYREYMKRTWRLVPLIY